MLKDSPNNTARRALGWTARVALSLLLVGWLLRKPETRTALAAFDQRTARAIATAVLLYAGCQLVNAYKWWVLLRATGHAVPYAATARVTFIGMFSNFFLPTSIGGDVIRIALATRYGVPGSTGALTVFLQRFTGFVAMLVIGLGGMLAGAATADQRPQQVLLIAAVFSLLGLAAMALGAVAERRWRIGERLPKPLGRPLRRISEGVRQLGGQPRAVAWVMAISLFYQLCMVGLQALLGLAAGVAPEPAHWFWVVPLMTIGEMVPLGLAGIGPREATAEFLFGRLGFGHSAVLASLLWQAMKVLTSLPGGLLLLGAERRPDEEPLP